MVVLKVIVCLIFARHMLEYVTYYNQPNSGRHQVNGGHLGAFESLGEGNGQFSYPGRDLLWLLSKVHLRKEAVALQGQKNTHPCCARIDGVKQLLPISEYAFVKDANESPPAIPGLL